MWACRIRLGNEKRVAEGEGGKGLRKKRYGEGGVGGKRESHKGGERQKAGGQRKKEEKRLR